MTASQVNAFLRRISAESSSRQRLRSSDPVAAAEFARELGFDVTVGDLVRYKARSTTWQLSDTELEVVVAWEPNGQPYWWQFAWPED
jgi:predicted ribosomally synthesized peptide with nif11-like leader